MRYEKPILVVGGGPGGMAVARDLGAEFASLSAMTRSGTAAIEGRAVVISFVPVPPADAPSAALLEGMQGVFSVGQGCADAKTPRLIVVSTLSLFSRLPSNWRVGADWRPRPAPTPGQLAPHLAELSLREAIRGAGVNGVVLRFPEFGPDSLESLLDTLRDTLAAEPEPYFWTIRHIGQRPAAPPDARPWREVLAPPTPIPSRPIRNVVIFGAGGPIATAAAAILKERYTLRLTNLEPFAVVREHGNRHQPTGAPLPQDPVAPHEERRCDVSDRDQVRAACEGMDAIVNCSVVRGTPQDFAVNALGCYHIGLAAAEHGIRRVVQTGPQLSALDPRVGYHADWEVCGNPPMRPGTFLYGHSKYLGQEILRIFAEWYDLEVPVLVFNGFSTAVSRSRNSFQTTFEESGDAIARAVDAPGFPSPYEVITVCNDLPQGRFSPQRALELLGWTTRDAMEDTWRD